MHYTGTFNRSSQPWYETLWSSPMSAPGAGITPTTRSFSKPEEQGDDQGWMPFNSGGQDTYPPPGTHNVHPSTSRLQLEQSSSRLPFPDRSQSTVPHGGESYQALPSAFENYGPSGPAPMWSHDSRHSHGYCEVDPHLSGRYGPQSTPPTSYTPHPLSYIYTERPGDLHPADQRGMFPPPPALSHAGEYHHRQQHQQKQESKELPIPAEETEPQGTSSSYGQTTMAMESWLRSQGFLRGLPANIPITLQALQNPKSVEDKPAYTMHQLAAVAIFSHPRQRASSSEIRDMLRERFPYYRDKKELGETLKHALSSYYLFRRVSRAHTQPGRGGLWELDVVTNPHGRRVRRQNSLSESPRSMEPRQLKIEDDEVPTSLGMNYSAPAIAQPVPRPIRRTPYAREVVPSNDSDFSLHYPYPSDSESSTPSDQSTGSYSGVQHLQVPESDSMMRENEELVFDESNPVAAPSGTTAELQVPPYHSSQVTAHRGRRSHTDPTGMRSSSSSSLTGRRSASTRPRR